MDHDYYRCDYSKDYTHGTVHHAKLKRWRVIDKDGTHHIVEGHYVFNNCDEGLVFRRRLKPSDEHTSVAASWGTGFWAFYKEIFDGE
jgi:hypothetical protein